jgi:cell fate regulator YaaT (PSP1 superfamily)
MDLPGHLAPFEYAEVRFKSTRKEFYRNSEKLSLNPGDAVVLECSTGYDLGIISAVGELARLQMERKGAMKNTRDLRRILRKASTDELNLWRDARGLEDQTMHRAREVAQILSLDMKISDVEYQGDKSKATFYYTAEGRIDFRELIRKLADAFRVRIEMRQIGARQEAARLGGIGSCGRELCCSTWLTDFRSVSTSAARYQQLALNTQKLAGQCGKLKCCLNYELDSYMDALQHFPKNYSKLKTKKGNAVHIKTDIFKGILWYVYHDEAVGNPIPLPIDRVKQILDMNQEGNFPEDLKDFLDVPEVVEEVYGNVVGQDSLTRFDNKRGSKRSGKRKKKGKPGEGATAVTGERQKSNNQRNSRNNNRNKPSTEGSTQGGQSAKPGDAAPKQGSGGKPNRGRPNQQSRKPKGPGNTTDGAA